MTRMTTPAPAFDSIADPESTACREGAVVPLRAVDDGDAALITVRGLAGGCEPMRRTLHARTGVARAGEADRAELLTLGAAVGLTWPAAALDGGLLGGRAVEWLVLSGEVLVDGERLATGDFLRHALSADGHRVEAVVPARLHVRMGVPVRRIAAVRTIARSAEATWEGVAGDFQRRLLWSDDAEAALLVRAPAGLTAAAHRHRIDEECLVLQGEVSTGTFCLRTGDYQIAPAGSTHAVARAAVDALVYVRCDADYDFARES